MSVFSLFHLSVFWSFISDLYSQEQANRLFVFLYAGIDSFFYFEQKEQLENYSRSESESILGWIEVAVNTVTLIISLYLTDKIIKKFGVLSALILLQILFFFSLIALAISPMLITLVIVQVISKTGNYLLHVRPEKYSLPTSAVKPYSKQNLLSISWLIEGGDMVIGWLYTLITLSISADGLRLGIVILSLITVGIAILWGLFRPPI